MEDRMDRSHAVRQTQYDRVRTCSADYLKRTEVFFSKFLRGSGRAEELSLNEGRGTEGKFGVGFGIGLPRLGNETGPVGCDPSRRNAARQGQWRTRGLGMTLNCVWGEQ